MSYVLTVTLMQEQGMHDVVVGTYTTHVETHEEGMIEGTKVCAQWERAHGTNESTFTIEKEK